MTFADPIVLTYAAIYLAALALATWQRKSFPLGETLVAVFFVGLGFTGVVYLVVPAPSTPSVRADIQNTEIIFALAYLVVIASALIFRKRPATENDNFLPSKLGTLAFKLFFFVFTPIAILRVFWNTSWVELGFTLGDWGSQLISALILIIMFGGFNLMAGSAAKPIRARQFNAGQLVLGFGVAYVWNILETGLVEEFFFRGFLQTRLVSYLDSPLGGVCATSLLFGLAHAPGLYLRGSDKQGPLGEHPTLLNAILYSIILISPTGWFTGMLFWHTQSLLAPILVHAGIDAVAATAEFINGLSFLKKLKTNALNS